jgi:hypothetical protein
MQKAGEEIPEPHRSSAWPDCLPMDILKLRNERHECSARQLFRREEQAGLNIFSLETLVFVEDVLHR